MQSRQPGTARIKPASSVTLIQRRDPILQQLCSDELVAIAMIPGRLHIDDAIQAACSLRQLGVARLASHLLGLEAQGPWAM